MFVGLVAVSTATAEPVSVNLQSSSGGFSSGTWSKGWFALDLGTLTMPAGSTATYLIQGLKHGSDYAVTFSLAGMPGWETLTAELLDPLDGDDRKDVASQPAYVPRGYSTSNKVDGFSFAQGSALARSATFAGGSGFVAADEDSHARDMLMFNGLAGAEMATVRFGVRDRIGGRGFLLRLSASDASGAAAPVPEPASMLLIGSGLAAMAAYRRRTRQQNGSGV